MVCPFTLCVPLEPVQIGGSRQVYERKNLLNHVEKNGTHPLFGQAITKSDIKPAIEGYVNIAQTCDDILNDEEQRKIFSEKEIKGFIILRQDSIAAAERFYKIEIEKLVNYVGNKTIAPSDFAAKAAALAEVLDPIMNEEAQKRRTRLMEEIKE